MCAQIVIAGAAAHGEQVIRTQGPGDFLGEIALLRDVPRTATVTAAEHTVLLSLTRAPFPQVMTDSTEFARALEGVVTPRMRIQP